MQACALVFPRLTSCAVRLRQVRIHTRSGTRSQPCQGSTAIRLAPPPTEHQLQQSRAGHRIPGEICCLGYVDYHYLRPKYFTDRDQTRMMLRAGTFSDAATCLSTSSRKLMKHTNRLSTVMAAILPFGARSVYCTTRSISTEMPSTRTRVLFD